MTVGHDDLGGNDVFGWDDQALWLRSRFAWGDGNFNYGVKDFGRFTSGFLSVKCRDE